MLLAVGMFSCSEPDQELIASNPKDPIAEDKGNSSGNSGGADTTEETGGSTNTNSRNALTTKFML
ncbi:MAG: hypothetical protein RLZZ241_839 [Bacteroidota bacterium]